MANEAVEITVAQLVVQSSPHLFALLVSKGKDEKINIMGVSWFCFASLNPPLMLFSLGNKGHTGKLIRETGEFTVCLPTALIKSQAYMTCKSSGADTDKVRSSGLKLIPCEGFAVPPVEKSKLAWSLKLQNTMPAGDHTVYLAEIQRAVRFSDENQLYAFNGYKAIDTINMKESEKEPF